jgi:uncharacterized protein (TIGR02145 family)
MWGEITNFDPSTTAGLSKGVDLVRMLEKINISFASQAAAGTGKLEIDQIILCNYQQEGLLTSRGWTWGAPGVSGHSPDDVPASAQLGFDNGIVYDIPPLADPSDYADLFRDEIFLFEASTRTDPKENVSLIIRGYYEGSSTPSYYRIDMADNNGDHLEIIRNHYYDIVITAINGPGYATGQEAYDNKPFNILTQINAWDESGMNDHTYDGRYQLTVDYSNFTADYIGYSISQNGYITVGSSQPLRIYTDVPAGWTIEIPAASNWISVSRISYDNSMVPFESTTVQIMCSPYNTIDDSYPRTGSFFIVAGGLRKEITVSQTALQWAKTNVDAPGTFATNPADFGMFYKWGYRGAWANSGAIVWDNNPVASAAIDWESVYDPCPIGWRVPKRDEFHALLNATRQHSFVGGVTGEWLTAAEAVTAGYGNNPGNVLGTAPNLIFLPAAGSRYTPNNLPVNQGSSATFYNGDSPAPGSSYYIILPTSTLASGLGVGTGTVGRSVRCVKDDDIGVVIDGIRWAETNVDAFGTFALTPEAPGMFYQWNRPGAWSPTGTVSGWDNTTPGGTTWEQANDPCPAGWRVPTQMQLNSLMNSGSTWETNWQGTGVNGRLFGTEPNRIFLPVVGYRAYSDGTLSGTPGEYWSSTGIGPSDAGNLTFDSTPPLVFGNPRNMGFSVRCVEE